MGHCQLDAVSFHERVSADFAAYGNPCVLRESYF